MLRYGTLYGPGTWYAPHGRIAARLRAGELRADDAVTSFVQSTTRPAPRCSP
ncbi:hypothetical protein AB0J71_42255 [Nonomuraea sp. NPDC049637]|uniref:hypothetical protein n=1 Tax=Nonomuraea sp. NPDC049637 TaxID=3154356 RepID=UPI003413E268